MRKPITIIVDLQEVENLEVSCHSEYCGVLIAKTMDNPCNQEEIDGPASRHNTYQGCLDLPMYARSSSSG